MITKKGFNVFIAILVIVSSKECMACFAENSNGKIEPIKTGERVLKNCHCEKDGYSVKHIKWIDPSGNEIEPLSTNTVETQNPRQALGNAKDKLLVVEVKEQDPKTGTKVYTNINDEDKYVSLYIKSMSKSMSGAYKCETEFEGNKYTKTFHLEAYDSLYFVNTNTSQHVVIGEDSLISCEVRGNLDRLETPWYLLQETGESKIDNNDKYHIISAKGLVVRNVNKDDGGTYRCTANDMATTEMIEKNISVQVMAKPVISELKANPGAIVPAGTRVTLLCIAEGIPHPEYIWSKIADLRGNPMGEHNATWQKSVNTIVFESIQRYDAGTYACESLNSVGNDSNTITIEVKVPPEIIEFENVTAIEGSTATIVCKATGESMPDVFLTYSAVEGLENDTGIVYNKKYSDNTSELYVTFMNVSQIYEGVYSCNATNDVDTVAEDIYFTVYYKPYFVDSIETIWGWNGKTVNMSCDPKSNPSSKITWRFQGEEIEQRKTTAEQVEANRFIVKLLNDSPESLAFSVDKNTMYGVYTCDATNDYGEAKKFINLRKAFPPAAIKNVTDIIKTATSITFDIEGPDSMDGPPVLGYVAQYDTQDNYPVTNIHLNRTWGLDRKFTIERLKPNTTYLMAFAAQNEAGVGVWSQMFEFDTPETSVPEAPTLDDSQPGYLRWKLPEANGIPIDHYIIEYCPFYDKVINHSLCREETLEATEFPLNSLDRSRTYSFKVRAHNTQGYSEYTDKEITTPEKLVGTLELSAAAIIGISVIVVILCLLLLDLLLFCWRKQGIIASCYFKKNKKKKDDNLQSRDKKGLLVKDTEARPDGSLTSPNNGHREFEYNKTTGVITGKHSTV